MRSVFVCLLAFTPLSHSANADFSGFATLKAVKTDSRTAKIRETISQPSGVTTDELDFSFSSIGLQAEWKINSSFDLVGQLLIKDQRNDKINNTLKLAFLRYSASSNWQFRAGRTGLDLFLMTEYRDIGYSMDLEHPPVEFYAIIPHQNLDGIDLQYRAPLSHGVASIKAYWGRSESPLYSDNGFFWNVELKSILGVVAQYETLNWLFRANYTTTKSANEHEQQGQLRDALAKVPLSFWPTKSQLIDSLFIQDKDFTYNALSMRYDDSNWLVQTEASLTDSNSSVLNHLKAGYITIGKRFDLNTLSISYSIAKSDNKEVEPGPTVPLPELVELYQAASMHSGFYQLDQSTTSLTWRRELSATLALKLNWQHTTTHRLPSAFYLHRADQFEEPDLSFNTFTLSFNWVF
ncbi:hypothetical protein J8Z24_12175 [Pseudoalteromonas sp. SCSIO 43201]|uniref:AsmA family protein n=1 Tax=Pseudoalteromonas TaxID=53246 RepID=UPI00207588BC|nr:MULTISPECIES: AsmA family protein [Pseudoalteromonas]MDW7547671.1 AsmA family protein [Pseudoalteromonas peptidolytica]USD27703.1 hypothetical protein J8Z24_12175 [Pseudoalteromonas sp. SCSIO 43201]